ncbi:site-specific integrase [Saccharicrinis sp. FJH62]|uniref:site-specific integrase n=1 Tax=Saccharicrinis sp. FJH62 TaxID=3344657 RepID=UPI0035D41D46
MNTFNLRFVARSASSKEKNMHRIYARITINHERKEFSLGYDITAKLFDSKAQRCTRTTREAKLANDFIDTMRFRINKIRKDLMFEGYEINLENIQRRINGIILEGENEVPLIIEFYLKHNTDLKQLIGIDIAYGTWQRHETSVMHVQKFIQHHYGEDDLPVDQIDFSFLNEYAMYLKTVRNCNHNSAMKYIKNMGKVIRLAFAEGHISKNPFDKFKLTYKPVLREALNQDEINKITVVKLTEKRLDQVRDLFLFCIYTGLAFVDLKKLRMEHIVKGQGDTLWIKNSRLKTQISFMVPLLPLPLKLIEKYSDHPLRKTEGIVIPTPSNQNYNSYLKELAIRAKIKKNLTTHLARHTFATTITLEQGVPLEVVLKC